MSIYAIARAGLDASAMRLTASAANIANAQSTGPVPGSEADRGGAGVYRPVRVETAPAAGGGVVAQMVQADPGFRLTYDPTAPKADERGMVAAPDVNVMDELVDQISAKLAFVANLKVIGTVADLERRTIEQWA